MASSDRTVKPRCDPCTFKNHLPEMELKELKENHLVHVDMCLMFHHVDKLAINLNDQILPNLNHQPILNSECKKESNIL